MIIKHTMIFLWLGVALNYSYSLNTLKPDSHQTMFYYHGHYLLQRDQKGVSYRADSDDIDFNNEQYLDSRRTTTPASSNRDLAKKLRKESNGLVQRNLNPTLVNKRNDMKVSYDVKRLHSKIIESALYLSV